MHVTGLDHLVLTVTDIDRTVDFYTTVLGATAETFDGGRRAVSFGDQKINLHPAADTYSPHASQPEPGSGDFCLIVDDPIETVLDRLDTHDVPVVHGPVAKVGARGELESVYIRDPDGNLVELARYDTDDPTDGSHDTAGWQHVSLDDLDARSAKPGQRWELSPELAIAEFNLNVAVLAPGERLSQNHFHYHEHQQELVYVAAGRCQVEVEDDRFVAEQDDLVRFDAGRAGAHLTHNPFAEPARLVAIGWPPEGRHPVHQLATLAEIQGQSD